MLVGYRVVSRVALGKPFVAVVVFFVVVSLLVAAASAAVAVFAIPVVVVAVPSAPAAVVSWIACFKTTIFSATSTDAMFSRWCFLQWHCWVSQLWPLVLGFNPVADVPQASSTLNSKAPEAPISDQETRSSTSTRSPPALGGCEWESGFRACAPL